MAASGAMGKHGYPAEAVYQDEPLAASLWLVFLFVQLMLRHPVFATSSSARFTRIALASVTIYLALRSPFVYQWHPFEKAAHLRVAMGVQSFFGALMATDFAFSNDPYHRVPIEGAKEVNGDGNGKENGGPAKEKTRKRPEKLGEESHGAVGIFAWTAEQVVNMRGIGWSWGLPPSRLPPPYTSPWGLVRRLFLVHLAITPAFAYCMLSRETRPRPFDAFGAFHDLLGIPIFAGSRLVANALLTTTFGLVVLGTMDQYFTAFALIVYVIQSTLHLALPSLIPAFDLRRWPPLYDSPHLSESITDLWGKRWHAIFRRSFDACAFKPASRLAAKVGASRRAQTAVGLFAVFVLSGIMHEFAIFLVDPPYDSIYSQGFPRTFSYFVLQGFAIIAIEPWLLPRVRSRFLRILWTWSFTLASAFTFRIGYLESGVDGPFPSPRVWSWVRWAIPCCSMMFGDVFTV